MQVAEQFITPTLWRQVKRKLAKESSLVHWFIELTNPNTLRSKYPVTPSVRSRLNEPGSVW